MRKLLAAAALAASMVMAGAGGATAADVSPMFGSAKVQTLSKADNQKIAGKGYYTYVEAYYGNLWSSYASSYGYYAELYGYNYPSTASGYAYYAYLYATYAATSYYNSYTNGSLGY